MQIYLITFNSKCIVLIGKIGDLSKQQKYSFELLRSNSRDVEIITFDEVKQKIKSLMKIMMGEAKIVGKKKTKKTKKKLILNCIQLVKSHHKINV